MTTARRPSTSDTRARLLDTALTLVRRHGFAATSIADLCTAAGVTKGAFFHHFASKEALGVAAAEHWGETTGKLFAAAPYHRPEDPLDRFLAYIAFRRSLLAGELHEYTCFAGTVVQEAYGDHPAIRAACGTVIEDHAATLEADIEAARQARGIGGDWSARSLALHTQAVLQGAFVLAKATNGVAVALETVDHLDRYVRLLFGIAEDPPDRAPPPPQRPTDNTIARKDR